MKNFQTFSIRLLSLIFVIAAIVGFSAGSAYASPREKVVICHIPPGNPDNMHTIEVGEPALTAHLAHGDMLSECAGEEEEHAESDDHEEYEESEEHEEIAGPTPGSISPAKVYSMRSIYGK